MLYYVIIAIQPSVPVDLRDLVSQAIDYRLDMHIKGRLTDPVQLPTDSQSSAKMGIFGVHLHGTLFGSAGAGASG